MRKYGKVECAIWGNPKFRLLSEDARNLFVYLLTCTHSNMIGCFFLPPEYAARDIIWSVERVSKGYTELYLNGFVTLCEQFSIVMINNFLKHNPFDNGNTSKAALKLFNEVPDKSIVKGRLASAIIEFCKHAHSPEILDILERYRNGIETVCHTHPDPVTGTGTVTGTETGACNSNFFVEQARPDQKKYRTKNSQSDGMQGELLEAKNETIQVFEYWKLKFQKTSRCVLDKKRKAAIDRALKSFSADELKMAIDGCIGDRDWMAKGFNNDIEFICRNAPNTEMFIGYFNNPRRTPQEIEIQKIMDLDLENHKPFW
jgi:hypothetical protein